jgi:UDP-2,3-diacylglucosamine pyrophosphatase LpxH
MDVTKSGKILCRTSSEVPMYKRLKPTVPVKEQTMNYAFPLFMCDILRDTRFCILQKLKQHKKKKKEKKKKKMMMKKKKKDESWQMLPTERD